MLDARGGGRLTIDALPAFKRPAELLFEASFADPNGQIQTSAQAAPVWPAGVQAGMPARSWVGVATPTQISGLALSPAGAPQAGVPMTITPLAPHTDSTPQPKVGGLTRRNSQ